MDLRTDNCFSQSLRDSFWESRTKELEELLKKLRLLPAKIGRVTAKKKDQITRKETATDPIWRGMHGPGPAEARERSQWQFPDEL